MTPHAHDTDFPCPVSPSPVPAVMAPSIGPTPPLHNSCKLIPSLVTVYKQFCLTAALLQYCEDPEQK